MAAVTDPLAEADALEKDWERDLDEMDARGVDTTEMRKIHNDTIAFLNRLEARACSKANKPTD